MLVPVLVVRRMDKLTTEADVAAEFDDERNPGHRTTTTTTVYFLMRCTSDTFVILAVFLYMLQLYKRWGTNGSPMESQCRKLAYIFQLARMILIFCILLEPIVKLQTNWVQFLIKGDTDVKDGGEDPSVDGTFFWPWETLSSTVLRGFITPVGNPRQNLELLFTMAVYVIDMLVILIWERITRRVWAFFFRDISPCECRTTERIQSKRGATMTLKKSRSRRF